MSLEKITFNDKKKSTANIKSKYSFSLDEMNDIKVLFNGLVDYYENNIIDPNAIGKYVCITIPQIVINSNESNKSYSISIQNDDGTLTPKKIYIFNTENNKFNEISSISSNDIGSKIYIEFEDPLSSYANISGIFTENN